PRLRLIPGCLQATPDVAGPVTWCASPTDPRERLPAPAAQTVRCDADATLEARTNIPSDVNGGHDRQRFITVTASSARTPFAGRTRRDGDGVPVQR
ncbi:MAG: hypothetical protein NTX54_11105, partial [Chloroflexi bacterium]|nr:hypothetical protein [Chloroflexota bacterium]